MHNSQFLIFNHRQSGVPQWRNFQSCKGFSLVEIIVAVAMFTIISVAAVTGVVSSVNVNRFAGDEVTAMQYAAEGLEAVRSIKNASYTIFATPSSAMGVVQAGNTWVWAGSNNTFDSGRYTRQLTLSAVDANTKKVTSTVTWNFVSGQTKTVDTSTYLTNWEGPLPVTAKGGMLVYGNGGTTSDAIAYKTLNPSTWTWSGAASTADVDSGSTTKYLRAARVYASATRNEKILVSRHYNTTGTTQWIYAQVFNGTSWGNVVQLATWTASTYLDVQRFDGTYLNNGDFMVVYSDNTTTPKFRVWNGSSWSASSISMQVSGGIPNYVVTKARPGTNEVMAMFFDASSDTNTEYFNGTGGYVTGSWALHTEHSAVAPTATKRHADFEWSANTTTTGALVYTDSSTDKAVTVKIFVANGSGGGAWGTAVNAGTAQTNNMGAIQISDRPGANEFHTCNKDGGTTPTIVCRKITFSGNVPTISNPTNPIVASATDTGIQRSFDMEFEGSGDPALIVYGDNTVIAKFKKYNAATATWDASATNVGSLTTSPVRSVRVYPDPNSNDVFVFMGDSNSADTPAGRDMYSVGWDGTNNVFYSSGGRTLTKQGTSGSATTDYWYGFAWDKY